MSRPTKSLPLPVMWLLMLAVTLIAYLPALNGALLWDDNMHVTRPELRSLQGLWRIWSDLPATQQYYPLLHSAFWLEHRLWGDAVLGYHLTNVTLHATSAFLLVLILRRFSLPGTWLAGFLFALHPVCVEAVAWISEQKSTLSGVFYLASALTYLSFDKTRRKSRYFLALALFLLALMSKTVTATLPAALLVIFWWRRGRLEGKRDVLPLIPWFVIGASAGLFTAWVERSPELIGAQGAQYSLTFLQRLLLAGRIPWFYAGKDILPLNLIFIYPHWTIDTGDLAQYCFPAGLLAVAAALIWLARRDRAPLAAFLFFLGTLFPALGFLNVFPFRYSYVADHFQYLALLGIVVPAAWGLTILANRFSQSRLVFVLPAVLAAATFLQCGVYRDYETLFRAALAGNPGSSFLHSNIGVILMSGGREAEAASQFAEAVRLTPDDASYRVNYGLALAQLPGRSADAIEQYRTALRMNPDLPTAHVNLGLSLASMPGHLQDAIAEYRKAISLGQTSLRGEAELWQAHFDLALALAQVPGEESTALDEYRIAIKLRPESALAHFQFGNTLQKLGRLTEAVAEYRTALSLDPDAPETHYELAYALAQIPGQVPEAIEECRKMLALRPGDGPGRQLMASLLAFQNGPSRPQ